MIQCDCLISPILAFTCYYRIENQIVRISLTSFLILEMMPRRQMFSFDTIFSFKKYQLFRVNRRRFNPFCRFNRLITNFCYRYTSKSEKYYDMLRISMDLNEDYFKLVGSNKILYCQIY